MFSEGVPFAGSKNGLHMSESGGQNIFQNFLPSRNYASIKEKGGKKKKIYER
jgi:hypothetical protein